ncbi:alpha-N-acetylneuraminide alpha-2,8-sialyltransferase [Pimephales promelas]|nr:alpha-N-acetylneuraminide alpha-2,8-sialyltransferase [Pimephales promelas]
MLPEDYPWSGRRLGRCAVVGSSGILKNSSCGREIDSTDFVIRFNLAVINDSDVGLKTDLITINPSQIRYKDMEKNPDPLVERVSVYGNASVIIPAFAYTFCTSVSIKVLKVLQPIRPHQPVVFFSPSYLRSLDRFWKGRGLRGDAPLHWVYANQHCTGTVDLQDQPIPYHYYDLNRPHPYMHKMPEEFVRLLQLHSQGALTLHLLPCDSPETDRENNLYTDQPIPYHYYDLSRPSSHMHKMPEEFVRLLQLHSQGALTLHLLPCDSQTHTCTMIVQRADRSDGIGTDLELGLY